MTRYKSLFHNKVTQVTLRHIISKPQVNQNRLYIQKYKSRSLRTIMRGLDIVRNEYRCQSFEITDTHVDNEFDKESLKVFLYPAILHIYGRDEHMGIIEIYTHAYNKGMC